MIAIDIYERLGIVDRGQSAFSLQAACFLQAMVRYEFHMHMHYHDIVSHFCADDRLAHAPHLWPGTLCNICVCTPSSLECAYTSLDG